MPKRPNRGRARTPRLFLEPLEPRLALSGVQPTAPEQLFLEQLNDLRANPAAYGAMIGLPDIASVAPAAPLAFDPRLVQSARQHSQDMNTNNYFAHNDKAGHDPGARMTAVGFPWVSYGESIAAGYPSSAAALKALIVDAGISNLGHRLHLLALDNSDRSVGIGVSTNGPGSLVDYYTIDTANTDDGRAFLTGVVFNDANGNGKYDIGEGVAGATVFVSGAGSVAAFDTGGYSLQLNPGTYTVTAAGGGLTIPITTTVTVGTSNVRVNFIAPDRTQVNSAPDNLQQLAGAFTHSTENLDRVVANAYWTYLKRGPEAGGMSYWVGRMAQGMTDEQLEASFLGSPEYRNDHGGSSATWLRGVYQELLGRTAQQGEIDHWVQVLAQGQSATDVALGFATSAEREGERLGATYQSVLGRMATADEVNYWVGRFQHGASTEDVAAGFLASQELYNGQGRGNVVGWVQAAYQNILGRGASGAEVIYWETQMN